MLSFQPSRKWRGISIHAPRTGSDAAVNAAIGQFADISIHAPRTGSDFCRRLPVPRGQYFNPRSPHGERRAKHDSLPPAIYISIHAPRTGSDAPSASRLTASRHFNPRSPHGERRRRTDPAEDPNQISIHAPRTGSDPRRQTALLHFCQISIHAPRTGSDRADAGERPGKRFQSTLPARGATRSGDSVPSRPPHFNPRSPHGERRVPVTIRV